MSPLSSARGSAAGRLWDSQKGHMNSCSLCMMTSCVVSRQRSPLVFLYFPLGLPGQDRRTPHCTPHKRVDDSLFNASSNTKVQPSQKGSSKSHAVTEMKSSLFSGSFLMAESGTVGVSKKESTCVVVETSFGGDGQKDTVKEEQFNYSTPWESRKDRG